MITGLADRPTEDVYHGRDTKQPRRLPKTIRPALRRRLDTIHAAASVQDLGAVRGARFEPRKATVRDLQRARERPVPRDLQIRRGQCE